MMRWMMQAALALVIASGCHARFKKNVASIDDVKLQALAVAGPDADLGRAYYAPNPNADSDAEVAANVVGSIATGVFNIVQSVKEAELREALAQVDIGRTNQAMLDGLANALGDGPPFAVGVPGQAEHLLQLELVDWGLQVPSVGVQGSFTYKVRARLYDGNGRRLYKSNLRCDIAAGDPKAVSQGLLLVNNAKQVKKMTPEQLQDAFDAMGEYCGSIFVAKMRRHAS